ncbi:UDP-N-acetylmuramoyl-L-alanyl-D-glutamate--2,6-diaminopimelate ligase [Selenihalanaerobacter shriftii]|uniref:UDP-N-acetylmuramoyl-L-alanyl-D-glutamate--2,6-diaminopimelate ligase n=1 Tax=Selenihalanaerobacter shriftii TaxID=142842 RepID=A0A1T4JZB3_9FIRM|nr:UDP-N-acetylmuramoyl-L-alanyl-D-glutamate--2,6-diaminopimelate ligase [Selenihalanaerobacter shriftii]SJZ35478.1 UDP-N-acetylmuramoylalanyl-D-glutamate--2,6-diaminopimelate ligase [Selenihalanaerobacter shriftii]
MKELSRIITELDYKVLQGSVDREITGIEYDSREVEADNLFVCISGFTHDGHDYINEAIEAGATAVLVEKEVELNECNEITVIMIRDTRQGLAMISSAFYDYPSQKLKVIGVTGTNGKTTTTYLTESILKTAGHKVGLIGTIKNKIDDEKFKSQRTTPESLDLQAFFARMVEEDVTHVVMEVSSHALALNRVDKIDFDVAIFTNITQDHLDFHDSFNDYLNAKAKLFTGLDDEDKTAIINIDDPNSDKILSASNGSVITYSIEKDANLKAKDITISPIGVNFLAEAFEEKVNLDLNLTGLFNVYNTLAALGAGISLNITLDDIQQGLEEVQGVAGRFEIVDEGQDFGVIVDYAHTPDSLQNILETAEDFVEGRVIVVFGCGGDRDKSKRPIMGQVATRLADFSIITSDNPRSEEPEDIINDIELGVKEINKKVEEDYVIIQDRAEAINYGIETARTGDLVFIVGKGHETYQILKDKTISFDDRQVAREALDKNRGE